MDNINVKKDNDMQSVTINNGLKSNPQSVNIIKEDNTLGAELLMNQDKINDKNGVKSPTNEIKLDNFSLEKTDDLDLDKLLNSNTSLNSSDNTIGNQSSIKSIK